MCKSLYKESSHIISHVAFTIDLYSASADDLDTVCRFLDFQEIREFPMKTQKPLIDFLVSEQDAQSESAKPFSSVDEDDEKKMPCPTVLLTY